MKIDGSYSSSKHGILKERQLRKGICMDLGLFIVRELQGVEGVALRVREISFFFFANDFCFSLLVFAMCITVSNYF